jgi:hypothetical protein
MMLFKVFASMFDSAARASEPSHRPRTGGGEGPECTPCAANAYAEQAAAQAREILGERQRSRAQAARGRARGR